MMKRLLLIAAPILTVAACAQRGPYQTYEFGRPIFSSRLS